MIFLEDPDFTLHQGDALEVLRTLPDESVHMCVTSPPFYGLRDYGTGSWEGGDPECGHKAGKNNSAPSMPHRNETELKFRSSSRYLNQGEPPTDACKCGARRVDQQIGLESTPDEWVANLVAVFREVRRVLRSDGTLWLEIGDSYSGNPASGGVRQARPEDKNPGEHQRTPSRPPVLGLKQKDLIGAPWLLAFALRADGWYLRSDIIWARPNPMPESVRDRPTKSHSYVFLLSKSPRYFFDQEAVREQTGSEMTWEEYEERRKGWGAPETNGEGVLTSYAGSNKSDGGKSHPAGRNIRSVWTIPTEPLPDEHYAAFPQRLVERCILAGSSERGCCPVCGAPWERVTEKGEPELRAWSTKGAGNYELKSNGWVERSLETGSTLKHVVPRETIGWRPTCAHFRTDEYGRAKDHAPVPCTVLDPFLGSGTTALVARRHGRRTIGVELSPAYCAMAARRTQQLSVLA